MKDYKIIESIKEDVLRAVSSVCNEKRIQIGSLIFAEFTKYNKEVIILDLLKLKINGNRNYSDWGYSYFSFRGNRVVIGSLIVDVFVGNRPYCCPSCNHPIKLDELRSKRESLGIFGDVEEACCVYCVVPR